MMYFLIYTILCVMILFCFLNFFRRHHIIRKVRSMSYLEKCRKLDGLIWPFGFQYDPCLDIFTTRVDSWQRDFGYSRLYDKSAPAMNMIFDSEPIYFDYEKRTWMIELWKGQYGISTGAEAGIYHANSVLTKDQRESALFHSVSDDEMLPISLRLKTKGTSEMLFVITQPHWWLAGFCMGRYSSPSDLTAEIAITFPNRDMMSSFLDGLSELGYSFYRICPGSNYVSFTFDRPKTGSISPLWRRVFIQCKNQLFCHLYLWITRPFDCTYDRLIYLYCYLPRIFRRMCCIRGDNKKKGGQQ